MKITHLCLGGPVTDNWSYQDNMLPKFHKRLGYEVSVVTSKSIWNDKGNIDIDKRDNYLNEYGIKTIRLDFERGESALSKFRVHKDLYETVEKEAPQILFVHGVQYLDIFKIVKYLKNKPDVVVYVDNHADFSNSATNFVSKNILHKILWRRCAKAIEPYAKKFYGVMPARCDFLHEMYGIPKDKIELLVMGADDDKVKEARESNAEKELREKYNINDDDFVIMTGGKIDSAKRQTLLLMEAVKQIENDKLKLIVFGSVAEEMKDKVSELSDGDKVKYIGWINSQDSYKYFNMSDLVVFPGRHSVFWEQVVGLGKPMVVKHWQGTTHVDVNGNCRFIYKDSVEEIKSIITDILDNNVYDKMLNAAKGEAAEEFLYSKIAAKSIKENKA